MLGGPNGSFANPGTDYLQAKIDIAEQNIKKTGKNINTNGSLTLTFDASADNAYCGYWTSLLGKDFTDLEELHFRIRTTGRMPEMLAGLRHAKQTAESAVPVREFLSGPDKSGWYDVAIPLSAFIGYGLPTYRNGCVVLQIRKKNFKRKGCRIHR